MSSSFENQGFIPATAEQLERQQGRYLTLEEVIQQDMVKKLGRSLEPKELASIPLSRGLAVKLKP
jgi:hypothetical protein